MINQHSFTFSYRVLQAIILIAMMYAIPDLSQAEHSDNFIQLHESYERLSSDLDNTIYGIPISIQSMDQNNQMRGEIYGRLEFPFHEIVQALATPRNWCDIAPLHPNIKVCSYKPTKEYCELTFYTGRKYYEAPEDVFQLSYQYQSINSQADYFHMSLTADDGPIGTSNYRIELEAIPTDDSGTFIHFTYSYKYNTITSLGMKTYLATIGSNKVGFSITGYDEQNQPVYIKGTQGIIERNAVRYYLAIKSYLKTQKLPIEKQFEARIYYWFDQTEKYHTQLFELNKKDYVSYKTQEYKDQARLQKAIISDYKDPDTCLSTR